MGRKYRIKRFVILFASILTLLTGITVYICFNSKVIGLDIFNISYQPKWSLSPVILYLVRSYLADLLWMISFSFFIQFVMDFRGKRIYLLFLCSSIGLLYELLQYLGIVSGTADWFDVLTYLLGCGFTIVFIKILYLGGFHYEKG